MLKTYFPFVANPYSSTSSRNPYTRYMFNDVTSTLAEQKVLKLS